MTGLVAKQSEPKLSHSGSQRGTCDEQSHGHDRGPRRARGRAR